MRENARVKELTSIGDVDNVVELPNLMSGRLADLLAAAGGPGEEHELRGELAARTAFQAAAESWPKSKRHRRRTPAMVAMTTVATMLVATTGLAAAAVLPGPAGRAVDGVLGSVGVTIGAPSTSPATPATGGGGPAVSPPATSVVGQADVAHPDCTVGGSAVTGSKGSPIHTTSCVITAPRAPKGAAVAASAKAATVHVATTTAPAPVGRTHRTGGSGSGSGSGSGHVPSTPPTTLPGGGTSRGGNIGGGGCDDTTSDTTPGATSSSGSSTTTTTSVPPTTTTTTTPAPSGGCGHGGRHGGGGTGSTTTTTTTTTTTATVAP